MSSKPSFLPVHKRDNIPGANPGSFHTGVRFFGSNRQHRGLSALTCRERTASVTGDTVPLTPPEEIPGRFAKKTSEKGMEPHRMNTGKELSASSLPVTLGFLFRHVAD